MKKNSIRFLVTGALIAAAYVALTFFSNILGLSYGPVQLRLSEVLAILPVFTPAAIPGLTVGCFIANIASFNPLDLLFGTLATLISALLTYYLRRFCIKGLPLLSFLPPIIVNALVIGLEISVFLLPYSPSFWGYAISAVQIGISQIIVCLVLGIPFYLAVKKYNIFKR